MLLPNEWIENSIETYIYQHTTKSQIIYWVVLAGGAAAIFFLPAFTCRYYCIAFYLCRHFRAGKWGSEAGD